MYIYLGRRYAEGAMIRALLKRSILRITRPSSRLLNIEIRMLR
jgi:hypothetical protein